MWWGDPLGVLELLTLHSFHEHGHEFHLWTYEDLKVPDFVVVRDANEIMPIDSLFCYNNVMDSGVEKGSKTGAADIFRAKMLYELGGWWVDMDVTCLKPFEIKNSYFFRHHWSNLTVGNAIKVPPKSHVMKMCYERYSKELNSENTDWHKSTRILSECVYDCKLSGCVKYGFANLDHSEELEEYIKTDCKLPPMWMMIHWCNSCVDLDEMHRDSALFNLLSKYKLLKVKLA